MRPLQEPPSSILILGAGVFGLGTAYDLACRPDYANTKITLVDRSNFPAPDGSSVDSSRIVRSDYSDLAYANLAQDAQAKWRKEWWGEGVYHEQGLAIAIKDPHDDSAMTRERQWMEESLQNMRRIGLQDGAQGDIQCFDFDAIKDYASMFRQADGTTGADNPSFGADLGYINRRSGWVDAEGAMRKLYEKAKSTKRIEFITGQVRSLLFESSAHASNSCIVTGASVTDGRTLKADLTILSTGAWTPSLLDMRHRGSATGQVLAYMHITDEEQAAFSQNPTILNQTNGLFVITPSNNILKVARHGYGYANRTTIPNPEPRPLDPSLPYEEHVTASLPLTSWDAPGTSPSDPKAQHIAADPEHAIPPEAIADLRRFLAETYPSLADRPFFQTRLCWYLDTPTSDFIIDYHPSYAGLFVATGGSGHGFKFAPVIGECIVKRIRREEVGHGLDDKWGWPEGTSEANEAGEEDGMVWACQIRGGRKGMELREEFAQGQKTL